LPFIYVASQSILIYVAVIIVVITHQVKFSVVSWNMGRFNVNFPSTLLLSRQQVLECNECNKTYR